jgi:hypothetical protein
LQTTHAAYSHEKRIADAKRVIILQPHVKNPDAISFLLERSS